MCDIALSQHAMQQALLGSADCHYVQTHRDAFAMKDRSVECGLATYVQCEFRHPATNTQDPREVHDHDRDITGKDTNPFSEGRETQLYYGRGKTGVPGEKTAARA